MSISTKVGSNSQSHADWSYKILMSSQILWLLW